MPGGEITIQAGMHPSGNWIAIPIMLANRETLVMVLDSGSPVSAIGRDTEGRLLQRGLINAGATSWLS